MCLPPTGQQVTVHFGFYLHFNFGSILFQFIDFDGFVCMYACMHVCMCVCVCVCVCVCSFSPTCVSEGALGDFRCTACQTGYEGRYCERSESSRYHLVLVDDTGSDITLTVCCHPAGALLVTTVTRHCQAGCVHHVTAAAGAHCGRCVML